MVLIRLNVVTRNESCRSCSAILEGLAAAQLECEALATRSNSGQPCRERLQILVGFVFCSSKISVADKIRVAGFNVVDEPVPHDTGGRRFARPSGNI